MSKSNNNISTNRKALYEYQLFDKFEAGIQLLGSEVKAIRENKVSLKEAYIRIKNNELYIIGMNISEYSHKGYSTHEPKRERKLLVHRSEIIKIKKSIEEKGMTIVPTSLYYKNRLIKISFAVAKGKKLWDKRKYKKDKDIEREMKRLK
tara:strand:- start:243 stop:689 length:447 start_codon:yes stop_codon:yes gene_type:complete